MFETKRMYKVITPIEKKGGVKYWMRLGSAFTNSDNSLNVYLDAIPVASIQPGTGITLNIREVTEEERRESAEKRASYQARRSSGASGEGAMRGTLDYNGLTTSSPSSSAAADNIPF